MNDARAKYIGLMYLTALHGDRDTILRSLDDIRDEMRKGILSIPGQDILYLLDANSAYSNAVLAGKLPIADHARAVVMANAFGRASASFREA